MSTLFGRWALATIASVVLAAAGCSSGDSGGASSGSGSGAVQLDASRVFKGDLTLTGTISLPKGAGAGKPIQLTASGGGTDITKNGSVVALAGTTPGETVPYTIVGLSAGEYTVRARVDQTGDGNVATKGDFDGHSGGTLEAPILDIAKAKKVTVGASGATGVDFGLGVVF